MFGSIETTRKLFMIEGMEKGEVQVKATPYLLSLPEEKQIHVLEEQLSALKRDLEKIISLSQSASAESVGVVHKTQIQILIQVIQGLLDRFGEA